MNYSSMGTTRLNEEEKDKLVQDLLPQVKVWAARAKSSLPDSVDIDEIYSAAALGLIECLDKYDKSKNASFSTFVEHRVKGAILDALRGMDMLSRGARGKIKMIESATNELKQQLGRTPLIGEIADHIGLEEQEVHGIMDMQGADKPLSLDDDMGSDDGSTLIEYIQSVDSNPEDKVVHNSVVSALGAEIDLLPERERTIISLYYYEELTMKEIAKILNITESRVSQLHSSAVKKMKRQLKDVL